MFDPRYGVIESAARLQHDQKPGGNDTPRPVAEIFNDGVAYIRPSAGLIRRRSLSRS
jgi:hypothetical protein